MDAREFHFSEGASNKFWKISVEGTAQTVHYGRVGTSGQVQTKAFASEADAVAASGKLIAEKVKKGYLEVAASGMPAAVAPKPAVVAKPAVATEAKPAAELDVVAVVAHASQAAEPGPAMGSAVRNIGLDPRDWFRAPWRDLEPLPRPAATAQFDLDAEFKRAMGIVKGKPYLYDWDMRLPETMSRQQAHFWLTVIKKATGPSPAAAVDALRGQDFDGNPVYDDAPFFGPLTYGRLSPELMQCLSVLLSPIELFDRILADEVHYYAAKDPYAAGSRSEWVYRQMTGFRRYVLPHLTMAERAELGNRLRPYMGGVTWPAPGGLCPHVGYFLAAALGMMDLIDPLVRSWADNRFQLPNAHANFHMVQDILFGLDDPHRMQQEMRRLKISLRHMADIRAWLAHTEADALDQPVALVRAQTNRDEAVRYIRTIIVVEAPELAVHMLDLTSTSKAPQIAHEWLEEHTAHAINGLVPVAAGRGKLSEAAVDYLRRRKKLGDGAAIAAALASLSADAASRVRTLVLDYVEREYSPLDDASTPADLQSALTQVVSNRKAAVDLRGLPPVVLNECRLNDAQMAQLIDGLIGSTLDEPHQVVAAVKQYATPSSLDAFAWSLFERWLSDGAPWKEKWRLIAVGLLGADPTALKLAPLVRKWPGELQHPRAVLGLECLRTIGTDTALMQINGIAQKCPFKGIKEQAVKCMDAIAKARGFTRSQLEDRIVPDCDLDERGSRVFDFGPRKFTFVLSPEMKAMVKDEDGKLKPELPKPNAKDDAALADQAVADWKLLKKQISEVARIQAIRLEQAMVTGRRWTAAEFDMLLLRHPLMTNLTRFILWGVYADNLPVAAFRVTEDQTLADANDEIYELPDDAQVGILHPLQMTAGDRSRWGEIWSDYELIPPFTQLGRAVLTLPAAERNIVELKRYASIKIPCAAVVYTLDKLGWTRGRPADGGGFNEHTKPFHGAGVTAVVRYDPGASVGWITEAEDQVIDEVFWIPGIYAADEWWPQHKKRLKWSDVDPVAVSEALTDVTAIVAKAKA